jgi:hypothetical protein
MVSQRRRKLFNRVISKSIPQPKMIGIQRYQNSRIEWYPETPPRGMGVSCNI